MTFDRPCGYRERETPGPMPNPEAKPLIADDTAPFGGGKVGRCMVFTVEFVFVFMSILFDFTSFIFILL